MTSHLHDNQLQHQQQQYTGVSLMQQYKKCQKLNQEQLRNAKNIEDLINIKVHTIDKQLVNKDNTYNFQYDPLQFGQQVPLMGDRTFLINQAILQKSSQKQRYAPSLSDGKDIFSGQTTKREYLQQFAHAGMDLEEFTASIERSSQVHMKESIGFQDPSLQEKDQQIQKAFVHEAHDDSISKDPVKILKSIFKKREFKKRPLETNQIANKYRRLQEQERHKEEQKRQKLLLLNQKNFKEDNDSKEGAPPTINTNQGTTYDREAVLNKNFIEQRHQQNKHLGYLDGQIDELLDSKYMREPTPGTALDYQDLKHRMPQTAPIYHQRAPAYQNFQRQDLPAEMRDFRSREHEVGSNNNQQAHQLSLIEEEQRDRAHQAFSFNMKGIENKSDGLSLKERLDNLRRMFDEEEQSILQEELDEDRFNEKDLKFPQELQSRKPKHERLQSDATSVNESEDQLEKEDLKQFLTNKIQEIKKRMNQGHPQFEKDQSKAQQFKASTLCKIQAVKNLGNERIEEQFKNRLNKTGVDYAFRNALVQQEKKYQKQLQNDHERQLAQLAEHKRVTMTAPTRKRNYKSENMRGQTAKDRNYVFSQIMKIEKINRETDKREQVKREEIKNDDIVQIIEETKKQIEIEDKQQEALELEQKYQEQLYIQELIQRQLQSQRPNDSINQSTPERQNQSSLTQNKSKKTKDQHRQGQQSNDGEISQSVDSEMRHQLFSREVQQKLQQQETETMYKSDEQSEGVSPMTHHAPINPPKAQQIRSNAISQSRLHGSRSRVNSRDKRRDFTRSNEYGVIFKPDHEYFTDSELLQHFGNHTQTGLRLSSAQSKSKRQKQKNQDLNTQSSLYKAFVTTKKIEFLKPELDPIQEDAEMKQTTSYNFSPRRFNRYPRFTIFMKPKEDELSADSKYVVQNTVSLTPQILTYLMDNQQHVQISNLKDIPNSHLFIEQAKEQGIIIKNHRTNDTQMVDPFEKVILVKGIDNSILTSFRTLKKQNNLISDTMKVIHNKFQPFKGRGYYFKMSEKMMLEKMPYPLTDNEEALDIAQAQLNDLNYRVSREVAVGQTLGSRETTHLDDLSAALVQNQLNSGELRAGQRLQKQQISPSFSQRERVQVFEDLNQAYRQPHQRNINTANIDQTGKTQLSQGQLIEIEDGENCRAKYKLPKNSSLMNTNQPQEEIKKRNDYFAAKNPHFQHDSRLLTANQDSYLESQDDNTISDMIHGQKYSSKVINQFSIPQQLQQVSQDQASILMQQNSPNNVSLAQTTTFQIPSNEPPQKISIHAKFRKSQKDNLDSPRKTLLNRDLNYQSDNNMGDRGVRRSANGSPSKSPGGRDKKETIILSKIDQFNHAFPEQFEGSAMGESLYPSTINQSHMNTMLRKQHTVKATPKNPFRSQPNRRQIISSKIQNSDLIQVQQTELADGSQPFDWAAFGQRVSQTAKHANRKQANRFEGQNRTSQSRFRKNDLSQSINQKLLKQHQILPPLLSNQQSQLQYAQTLQALKISSGNNSVSSNNQGRQIYSQLPIGNSSKIKQVIDDLYTKEKRYIKQYVREDMLAVQNPIFNLSKFQNLQTSTHLTTKSDLRVNSVAGYNPLYNGMNLPNTQPFSSGTSQGINFRDEGFSELMVSQHEKIRQQVNLPNQYDYTLKNDQTGSTFKNSAILQEMKSSTALK